MSNAIVKAKMDEDGAKIGQRLGEDGVLAEYLYKREGLYYDKKRLLRGFRWGFSP